MLRKIIQFQKLSFREILATTVGIAGGIGVIAFITYICHCPLLIASFGASAVLLYAATSSPLAQPRNLIGGHVIAATVLSHGNYLFILFPVLTGAVILLISALLANKISPQRSYPFRANR